MSELKQIATTEGSHTITAKVSRIDEKAFNSGPAYIIFLEGYAGDIFSKTKPPFEVGYEGQINVDARPSKNDANKLSFFLGRPKTAGGFAGGGRPPSAPKTKEEIHSASICGVIKSCLEREKTLDEAQRWIDLYLDNIKKVAG